MDIYWCNIVDDDSGLYIVAKSRSSAKALFAGIVGERFVDIRCNLCRKDVNEKNEGEIDLGDRRLEKYDLYYRGEDGNGIQLLFDEKSAIERKAIKEFAEKLKTKAFDKDMFNDWAGATYVVLVREIDKLLKEYE